MCRVLGSHTDLLVCSVCGGVKVEEKGAARATTPVSDGKGVGVRGPKQARGRVYKGNREQRPKAERLIRGDENSPVEKLQRLEEQWRRNREEGQIKEMLKNSRTMG